ncbi:MAG: S41 family peptidase [Candidatus Berkelbacteria bacterium]|nr:S41 family peptidase [Candidatus Berkelbacteria bacterium]
MEKKSRKKVFLKIIPAILLVFFLFGSGYFFGLKIGDSYQPPADIQNANSGKPSSVDFSLFWQAWNKVRQMYVGDSDPQKMVFGAISGMVAALGDPYTDFFDPTTNQQFSSDLSGQFEGIGAELIMKDGAITVVAPLSGSPAEKAGIKAKDIISEIDGTSTAEMTVDDAVGKIRGTAGTEVKLKIIRANETAPLDFTITRAKIQIDSVTYQQINVSGKKIGLLKVNQFGDDTQTLAEKYAKQIKSDDDTGVILDLRNNPGGYLDGAVSFANLFLTKGKVVVSEVDKNGQKQEYKTDTDPVLGNIPLVVLVNGGSASAAEIVTGAFKDFARAETIGEKTFGKGSVQAVEPLAGGAALKVTIAKWLTPLGTEINKIGITPDVVVPASTDNASDPQLDKAKLEITK